MTKLNRNKTSFGEKVFWINVWQRFKSGDRNAFTEIYNKYINVLFAYGSGITSDKELVKDCIQDLFIDLYRYKINLQKPKSLEFYLMKSLKRLILKKHKRNSKFDYFGNESLPELNFRFDLEDNYIKTESEKTGNQILQSALNSLNDKNKELLFYKFNSNLTYKEIGQLTGAKKETVKKQVYRIILTLRKKLENKTHVN